jgi:hypothetical protein
MIERKYLPTTGQLIDDLQIKLMKSIFIDRDSYRAAMADIMHDLFGGQKVLVDAKFVLDISVLMLSNCTIWQNEAIARKSGKGGRLRFTHSINGVRTRAKNEINKMFGERIDEKIDCLAADLPEEMGNWRVFDD